MPADPTRTGYTFRYWDVKPLESHDEDDSEMNYESNLRMVSSEMTFEELAELNNNKLQAVTEDLIATAVYEINRNNFV